MLDLPGALPIVGLLAVLQYRVGRLALQVRTGLLSCIGAPLAGSRPTVGATMRKSWRLTRAQQRFLELLTVASAGIGADASRQSLIEPYWT